MNVADTSGERHYQSAPETRERLAAIETRAAERWHWVQGEFQKLEKRLGDVEALCRGFATGAKNGSPLMLVIKEHGPLIAALVLGAMLGKAGINPLDWLIQ
jgi:hypothetical protein